MKQLKKQLIFRVAALFILSIITGCTPLLTPSPTVTSTALVAASSPYPPPTATVGAYGRTPLLLSLDGLKNMAVYSADILSLLPAGVGNGSIKLVNGEFHQKYGGDSVLEMSVVLSRAAFGDLNQDGVEDAALILMVNGGGSGIFIYLAAVINQNGKAQDAAYRLLGDRVKMDTLSIKGGKIAVSYLQQGPDDPLCCPTQKTSAVLELQGSRLVPSP